MKTKNFKSKSIYKEKISELENQLRQGKCKIEDKHFKIRLVFWVMMLFTAGWVGLEYFGKEFIGNAIILTIPICILFSHLYNKFVHIEEEYKVKCSNEIRELDECKKQYKDYCQLKSEEIQVSYEQALPSLDEIKRNFLFRKQLLSSNIIQWQKWSEYKRILNSLELDPDIDWNFSQRLLILILEHKNYAESRNSENPRSASRNINNITESSTISNNLANKEPEKTPSKEEKAILDCDTFLNRMLKKSKQSTNYNIERTVLGLKGEEYILLKEKEKLLLRGIDTSKYPVHVSKLHGDEFGFDILTLDTDLEPLLLEVKTTRKNKNQPFYLTRNEFNKMKNYKKQYRIVRLYDFDEIANTGKIEYITKNNLENKFRLQEQLYKVYTSS